MPDAPGDTAVRVLHVVRQFKPCIGGLEDNVYNLAQYQRRHQDIDARVLTLDRPFTDPARRLPHAEVIDGLPVRRIGWAGSSRYPLAPAVFRHLAGVDLIHVHAIDFFFDALALAAPLHGKPMVATTHGGFFHTDSQSRLKHLYFNTVTRFSVRAYRRIIACSANDAAMFAPLAADRLCTIQNGVDIARFHDRAAPAPTRRLITIGRFARHKRIAALFPLLARLRDHADWQLTVAGAPGDQPVEELRQQAQVLGLGDAVSFLCQPDEAALAAAIGTASYFISASSHEGFGIAAVEALSAGLLPVLSNIPPFAALLGHAGAGILFDPAAPDHALSRLLEIDAAGGVDPATRAALIRSADAYAWPAAAAAYARVYTAALTRNPAPAPPALATH